MFFFVLIKLMIAVAFAFSGNVAKQTYLAPSSNWKPQNPTIVLAFGLLNQKQKKMYQGLDETLKTQAKSLHISVSVLKNATGSQVAQALKNPDTIGIIWISHSFAEKKTESAVLVDAAGWPLPGGILSSATPSLRFIALLGCYGNQILNHYQVEYEFNKLPGTQTEYHTTDKLLATGLLSIDGVKNALNTIITDIKKLDLENNTTPAEQPVGYIELQTEDVVRGIEPRFVYFNNSIIGTLEQQENFLDRTPQIFNFELYPWQITKNKCKAHVSIMSSELTPGTPVDDYLIQSVIGVFMNNRFEKHFLMDSLHIGDDLSPPLNLQDEIHSMNKEIRTLLKSPSKSQKRNSQNLSAKLLSLSKLREWLNPALPGWDSPPKRIFSQCLD